MSLFTSSRKFEVWDWGVGHGGLLLRSNPPRDGDTRIEVLFKPAHAVGLPSLFTGLVVEDGGPKPILDSAPAVLGRLLKPWEHLYSLAFGAAEWVEDATPIDRVGSWVVAGGISGRQDRESYSAPTMFDGWAPRPGVETLFEFRTDGGSPCPRSPDSRRYRSWPENALTPIDSEGLLRHLGSCIVALREGR